MRVARSCAVFLFGYIGVSLYPPAPRPHFRVARARQVPQPSQATWLVVRQVAEVPIPQQGSIYFPGLSRDFDCFDFILEWDGMSGMEVVFDSLIFLAVLIV